MEHEKSIIGIDELSELLVNKDIETIKKFLRLYGRLTVNVALLRNAVLQKLSLPKIRGYPPGVFIAYRWENDKHKEWVFRLATYLKNKGYKIFLDQFDVDLQPDEFYRVPDFISHIAECQYFLVVLSPGYIDNVTARRNKTSWVYDEYQQALYLVQNMRIKIRAVIATGNESLTICDDYNTVNLSDYSEDFDKLSHIFSFENRVSLSESYNAALMETLIQSDLFLEKGNLNEAYNILFQYPDFNDFFEIKFRAMKCLVTAQGHLAEAVEIATAILDQAGADPEWSFSITEVLTAGGQYKPALKKLLMLKKIISQRSTFNSRIRGQDMTLKLNYFDTYPDLISDSIFIECYLKLGSVLDDLKSYHSAIAHYHVSLNLLEEKNLQGRALLLNNIGASYLRLEKFDIAKDFFKKSIELNPGDSRPYSSLIASLLALKHEKEAKGVHEKAMTLFPDFPDELTTFIIPEKPDLNEITEGKSDHELKGKKISCSHCKADFVQDTKTQNMCGDCATSYDNSEKNCPVCGNDGVVPLLILEIKDLNFQLLCPVCLKGVISEK